MIPKSIPGGLVHPCESVEFVSSFKKRIIVFWKPIGYGLTKTGQKALAEGEDTIIE